MEAGARPDGRLNKTFTGGTALRVAEAAGHTTIVSFLRGHRRAPAPAAAASVSVEERAAAERNAELAATALLAEEAAEGTRKQHAQQKKASKKSKAKMGANADSGGAADRAKAVAVTEAAVAAEPAAVATADEALRRAMALAQYEALARALEEHCTQASEGVLTEARALRERLHKKHTKESQKLVGARRAGVRVRRRGCAGVAWAAGSLNALSVRARTAGLDVGRGRPGARPRNCSLLWFTRRILYFSAFYKVLA